MAVTINGSTGISGVDGSAGTPALIGSDADTGIFLAAGQVSASVNGTAGNVPLVSGTAQASTSGTSIDFTGIPSWVKRVTVMFQGVSGSGTSPFAIQLGTSSGIDTGSTYGGSASYGGSGTTDFNSTSFRISASGAQVAANVHSGIVTIASFGSNIWCESGTIGPHASNAPSYSAGSKTLSGTLDRIRITTVNGTDTFDAGSINILYE